MISLYFIFYNLLSLSLSLSHTFALSLAHSRVEVKPGQGLNMLTVCDRAARTQNSAVYIF